MIFTHLLIFNFTIWYSLAVKCPLISCVKSPHCVTSKGACLQRNCGTRVLLSFETQLPNVFYYTLLHHTAPWRAASTQSKSNGQPTVHETSKSTNQNNTSLFTVGGCYGDYLSDFSVLKQTPTKGNVRTNRARPHGRKDETVGTLHPIQRQTELDTSALSSCYLLFSPELQPTEQCHPQLKWVFPPQ